MDIKSEPAEVQSGSHGATHSDSHAWGRVGFHDVVYFLYYFHLYDYVGNPRVECDERNMVTHSFTTTIQVSDNKPYTISIVSDNSAVDVLSYAKSIAK